MPSYAEFCIDSEGYLWVEDYRKPGDERSRWTVFDLDGLMLGRVELPDRFTIHQIGRDFVLGTWIDEMDVEHVRLYALIKP
jgi:sugar lactone lactonase YvrE